MPDLALPALSVQASGRAGPEPTSTHPEEMKAVYDVRVGKWVTLQGSARITPAGAVCTGIAVAAILLATAALVRAARR
ncbi:hypothetical protein FO470_02895 [Starkeya sp. 3C]|uniref:Uncharacterized protein n=1 Tax=Ancylobacter moscoviensis TaxID=2597768 RepID=A0ABY3DVA2_9HYPH|nr:hypothetical protein [Ancylobacter moscoviensis]TSJ64250.1 hypothetical protein FO470_02895 [Ancylobacter moscoviensis]